MNVFQLPVALAPNFTSVIVGRCLGGLSSAGGSVTLGMIADMWDADTQQYAVAFVVFSSVAGSVFGPVVGGFSEQYLDWRWSIWIQLIFGVAVQLRESEAPTCTAHRGPAFDSLCHQRIGSTDIHRLAILLAAASGILASILLYLFAQLRLFRAWNVPSHQPRLASIRQALPLISSSSGLLSPEF